MARPVDVETYMAALQHRAKPQVEALRRLILAAVPGIGERIKWNAPSYGMGEDDRITMRLQPGDRLDLVLHRGAKARPSGGFVFADPDGLIVWAAPDRGVIALDPDQPLDDNPALAELLRRWIAATL